MTRGWFDLFRDDGGPTLYAYSNRTSVIGDSTSITLYIVFATLFIAFFVVFPGIRKEVILSDQPYSNVKKFLIFLCLVLTQHIVHIAYL